MLLYDQVYWQLTFGEHEHFTPIQLHPEMARYTILIDAISKCWAATGLRVGWGVVPPWIRGRMKPLVGHMGAWAGRPAQMATARLLDDPERVAPWMDEFRGDIQERLVTLRDGLWSMRDSGLPVDALDAQGAMYLSARFDLFGKTAPDGRVIQSDEDMRRLLLEEADVAVVVAYGRILIPELLSAPKHGCINVHASLLPKYRGAAPINWAVVHGETESGVMTMQMAEGLDTGDILLEARTAVGPNETAGDLYARLAPMGAELAVRTLAEIDSIAPRAQDHSAHTLAPLISRDMAQIDWSQPAAVIHDQVRGFNPWPIAWTTLSGERMKVHRTRLVEGDAAPGRILSASKSIVVGTGSGAIELTEVQLPGRRAQPGRDVINSGRVAEGMVLGEVT